MRKIWILFSVLFVVVFSGCSWWKDDSSDSESSSSPTSPSTSTYTARITVENINESASVDVTVDGSQKTILAGSSATWTVSWSGTTTYKVVITTSTDSESVYVENGQSASLTVGTKPTNSIQYLEKFTIKKIKENKDEK